jgi:ferredoxin
VCRTRIAIDRDGCISCGSCEEKCPEVFKLDEDNLSSVVLKYRKAEPGKGEVGKDLAACVEAAKDSCPVCVISTD